MADAAILKIEKLRCLQIPKSFGRFWRNFASVIQKFNFFRNPRWRTAAVLKTVRRDISSTVSPILMKFGTVMHSDSHFNPNGYYNLKFLKSKMTDGHHPENRNITISSQPFGRFWRKLAFPTLTALQKFKFKKSKMADNRHFENC